MSICIPQIVFAMRISYMGPQDLDSLRGALGWVVASFAGGQTRRVVGIQYTCSVPAVEDCSMHLTSEHGLNHFPIIIIQHFISPQSIANYKISILSIILSLILQPGH